MIDPKLSKDVKTITLSYTFFEVGGKTPPAPMAPAAHGRPRRSRAREQRRTAPRKGSLLRTIKAVAWSFFGIRKKSAYQDDLSKLNPLHIIAVALVAVALFVGGLMLLVQLGRGNVVTQAFKTRIEETRSSK